MQLHLIFVQAGRDPMRNPLDPTQPPGFIVAHIGTTVIGVPTITTTISGSYLKNSCAGGYAWICDTNGLRRPEQQGFFCYTSSRILLEATACLRAMM